ncbi:MAG: glycosyltransferase [Verrucomicrobiales bacterium]|nr:glycosyltransferase [Verrucomicrobiales bacterium]
MIPKTFHYCWFGGGELCDLSRRCMDTWSKVCPEYEVMHWDESGIDLTDPFIAENIEKKQWAFVADYVRLQKLWQHGGIYLDTDIELVKSPDTLLQHSCFIGEEMPGRVNSAVLGAEAGNPFVKECLDYMKERFEASKPYLIAPEVCSRVIRQHPDVTVFGPEYFYPYNPYNNRPDNKQLMYSDITEHTYAIHHWAKSWSMPIHQKIFRKLGGLIGA